MPVNCELEPDALEQQIGAAKVKVRKFHVELFLFVSCRSLFPKK